MPSAAAIRIQPKLAEVIYLPGSRKAQRWNGTLAEQVAEEFATVQDELRHLPVKRNGVWRGR